MDIKKGSDWKKQNKITQSPAKKKRGGMGGDTQINSYNIFISVTNYTENCL